MPRIALIAVLLSPLTACGSSATEGLTGDPAAGANVYAANCASCHGVNGEGGTGPALAGEAEETAELEDIILNGEGEMPAIPLEDQELADVIAYLQETFGGDDD